MQQTKQSTPEKNRRRFNLTENTVIDLDGVRIGLANVWEESFDKSNSHQKRGVRGTLCAMHSDSTKDYDLRVSKGDEIVIAGKYFRVINLSEGEPHGSLTLEQIEAFETDRNDSPCHSDEVSCASNLNWGDFLLPVPFLYMPYVVNSETGRALLAAVCLIVWVVFMRPKWKVLQGFYTTVLLLLHALFRVIVAACSRLFG